MKMENLEERIRWQTELIRSTREDQRRIAEKLEEAKKDYEKQHTIDASCWLAHLRGYNRSLKETLRVQEETLRTLTMRREYGVEKEPVHGVPDAGLDAKDLP